MRYNVRLSNGTTGTINGETLNGQHASDFIGELVHVESYDENGNPIRLTGVLADILEEKQDWE